MQKRITVHFENVFYRRTYLINSSPEEFINQKLKRFNILDYERVNEKAFSIKTKRIGKVIVTVVGVYETQYQTAQRRLLFILSKQFVKNEEKFRSNHQILNKYRQRYFYLVKQIFSIHGPLARNTKFLTKQLNRFDTEKMWFQQKGVIYSTTMNFDL